jgi:phospholipid/cholesterol/gamma-HCH transport system permease protein
VSEASPPHPETVVTATHPAAVGTLTRRFRARGWRIADRWRLAVDTLYWLVWLAFARRVVGRSGVAREFEALGLGALPMVMGATILVGLIATFQIAFQLHAFSAESVSARAIGWFSARELGPITVAILIVARSSSAIAGELAAMTANAEVDALRAMALDPVKYLFAPKLAAMLLVLPSMTIIADALIPVGGWIGNALFLGFSTNFFLEQFRDAFAVRDLVIGLGKSVLFALVIVLLAADEGLSVERSVGAISEAATRGVVFGLIGVLGTDTLVNAVFYFIPGLI